MSEKIITDVTALQCKKNFLAFVDDLYNKYPPMTFQEYRDADGNHTNWFPQRIYQITASTYREWFTLAVLNNRNFIERVFKYRVPEPEADKIFSSIINSAEFRRYILEDSFSIYYFSYILQRYKHYQVHELKDYVYLSVDGTVKIDYNHILDISRLIDYYNDIFRSGNINTVSANIQIRDTIIDLIKKSKMSEHFELLYPIKQKYIYDVGSQKCLNAHQMTPYLNMPMTVYDIDNIYTFQVGSNSIIIFEYLDMYDRDLEDRDFKRLNPVKTFSTLLENIVDILK